MYMTMELSDYWVWSAKEIDPSDPKARGAHTHHLQLMKDAKVMQGATGLSSADAPATTTRFAVSGDAAEFITGNGSPGPFEAKGPTSLQVCVTGGSDVAYSNVTVVMTGPATGHFGTQPIHGVVRFVGREEEHH